MGQSDDDYRGVKNHHLLTGIWSTELKRGFYLTFNSNLIPID